MTTFLTATAGVIAGLAIIALAAWLWLRWKFRGLGEMLSNLLDSGGVPPFRVTLQTSTEPEWSDAAAVQSATRGFEAAGWAAVGDYEIPEMEGVRVRGLWHRELETFAAITDHPEAPLFADFLRLFRDRTILVVSTAPETGMDTPDHVLHVRRELDITALETAGQLHELLLAQSGNAEPVRKQANSFASVFVSMYEMEMNWRIERGGVTPEEIHRAAELGGLDAPDDDAIRLVQAGWRVAIEGFVDESTQKAFLPYSGISAADWEDKRDRLAIVHEFGDRDDHISALASVLCESEFVPASDDEDGPDEEAYDAAYQRVATSFERRSIREGFAAALVLLPEKASYEAIGSIEAPWPTDFYLVPNLY